MRGILGYLFARFSPMPGGISGMRGSPSHKGANAFFAPAPEALKRSGKRSLAGAADTRKAPDHLPVLRGPARRTEARHPSL